MSESAAGQDRKRAALAQARIASVFRDHPHSRCLQGDVYAPGAASFMLKLVHTRR